MSIQESGFLSPEIDWYRQRIRKRYADYFVLIERADQCCHAAKVKFEVHNKDRQEIIAVGLFLKLLADAEAATLLLERGMVSSARSLLRVGIEATITLAKVCKEYQFSRVYGIVAEQERLRLIKGIKNNSNAGYDILRSEFTETLVKEIESTVGGEPKANLCQWATDVGMTPLYAGPYRLFSADVHSGGASLNNFYIQDETGNITGINWGLELKDDSRAEVLEGAHLLITGLALACELFKIDFHKEADPIYEEYKRLGALTADTK